MGVPLTQIFFIDVDGDGLLDLVWGDPNGLIQYRPGLARTFGFARPLIGGWNPVAIADFNGDGASDIFARSLSGDAWGIFLHTCGRPVFARAFLIPVVLSTRGFAGTSYQSELTLTNRGPVPIAAELTYQATSGGGSGTTRLGLAAGEQRVLPDAVAALRLLGLPIPEEGDAIGSLTIRFTGLVSPADASAQARVLTPVAGGRVGVAFPSLAVDRAFAGSSFIPWLAETAADRSNLAFVNASTKGLTLRVTLNSGDPARPDSAVSEISLAPGEFRQVNRTLPTSGLGASSGWARIDIVSGTGPYFAYATINDNQTSDGSIVPAVSLGAEFFPAVVIPVVVEGAGFTTELVATNVSTLMRTVQMEFVAEAVATAEHSVRFTFDVPAGAQVAIPDVVQFLRASGVSGMGPAGPTFAGPIFALEAYGRAGFLLFARTSRHGAVGGVGTSYGTSNPLDTRPPISKGWLDGLRQDETSRTNLAIVNLGSGTSDVFRVEIFDGASGRLVGRTDGITVRPKGWMQLDGLLSVYAPGVTNAYARVTLTAGAEPFLAYAVVNDGAWPGLGTGDGSFIAMEADPRP